MNRLTREWVRKAEADWAAARRLACPEVLLHDPVCFHCQQAVEKYLKALLQERGLTVPRTHDVEDLLDLLLPHDPALRPLRRGLNRLTGFAVEYRYPGVHATSRQMRAAIRLTERARREFRSRLGLRTPP